MVVVGNATDVRLKNHVVYVPWVFGEFHGCHEAIIEMLISNDKMSKNLKRHFYQGLVDGGLIRRIMQ
jgi:hypothetical protein